MTAPYAPAVDRVKGYCGLCIARCGTVATVAGGRFMRLDPDPTHPTGAAICAKGGQLPNWSTTRIG
jgi:anaerobic selenocysteine-containing dehydrogenase